MIRIRAEDASCDPGTTMCTKDMYETSVLNSGLLITTPAITGNLQVMRSSNEPNTGITLYVNFTQIATAYPLNSTQIYNLAFLMPKTEITVPNN
jgi:hypothetical protein